MVNRRNKLNQTWSTPFCAPLPVQAILSVNDLIFGAFNVQGLTCLYLLQACLRAGAGRQVSGAGGAAGAQREGRVRHRLSQGQPEKGLNTMHQYDHLII